MSRQNLDRLFVTLNAAAHKGDLEALEAAKEALLAAIHGREWWKEFSPYEGLVMILGENRLANLNRRANLNATAAAREREKLSTSVQKISLVDAFNLAFIGGENG